MKNSREGNRRRAAAFRERHGSSRVKEWKTENPDKVFISSMKRQGINCTWEQRQAMLSAQGQVCAICHRPEKVERNGKRKALAVDHDHITGKIRGMICSACNQGLGNFADSPHLLRNAIAYLEASHAL